MGVQQPIVQDTKGDNATFVAMEHNTSTSMAYNPDVMYPSTHQVPPPIDYGADFARPPYMSQPMYQPQQQLVPTCSHITQIELVNAHTYNEPMPQFLASVLSQEEYDQIVGRCRNLRNGVQTQPRYNPEEDAKMMSRRRRNQNIINLIFIMILLVFVGGGMAMMSLGIRALTNRKYARQTALLGVGIGTAVVSLVFSILCWRFALHRWAGAGNNTTTFQPPDITQYNLYLKEIRLYYASRGLAISGAYWPGTSKSALLFEFYHMGVPQHFYNALSVD